MFYSTSEVSSSMWKSILSLVFMFHHWLYLWPKADAFGVSPPSPHPTPTWEHLRIFSSLFLVLFRLIWTACSLAARGHVHCDLILHVYSQTFRIPAHTKQHKNHISQLDKYSIYHIYFKGPIHWLYRSAPASLNMSVNHPCFICGFLAATSIFEAQ